MEFVMDNGRSEDEEFYEIEYDSGPFPGVGKFVRKLQKKEEVQRDEVRERFSRMRDIARKKYVWQYGGARSYDRRMQQERAEIFCEQGLFMEDFEDDYPKAALISSPFPDYQMMGYEQLRTYFTWRTQVRRGDVEDTCLSFAFLYLYELLNGIGAENPQDGLEKIIFFWREFREYNSSVDKYVIRWLKDYYIYYGLPGSFKEFAAENDLTAYYPQAAGRDDFELYCGISKYDIRKSSFYKEEYISLIRGCFNFTMRRLREKMEQHNMSPDEVIFRPSRNSGVWIPFPTALFCPRRRQPDRHVVISENEVYFCRQNRWTYSTVLTADAGRQFLGYVMKQMEAVLRKQVKYKYALSADIKNVPPVLAVQMAERGIPLEKLVTDAVTDFYRESTKIVVRVDQRNLEKIRSEALMTQERLIVPEEEEVLSPEPERRAPEHPVQEAREEAGLSLPVFHADYGKTGRTGGDPWSAFRDSLTADEAEALRMITGGSFDSRKFAMEHGMMPEILLDEINGKAMDCIGDCILDDEFVIYEDYTEQVKEMVE